MTKRKTTSELLAEFNRLYDVAATIHDCRIKHGLALSRLPGITPRDAMLGWVEARKATASQLVSGVRQALRDVSEGLVLDLGEGPGQVPAQQTLACYQARTGRDYWEDAGHQDKVAKLARAMPDKKRI